jgi:hypothetical protein
LVKVGLGEIQRQRGERFFVVCVEPSIGKVRRSTWEVGEHGSGEVKSHARKRQTPESRKAKGQVRKILGQVSLGMRVRMG